ncbi:MAG: PAS domain S-box protein [Aphanothece sp. CMT-3BRIN-NPC111]|nr:PAS domain S-box protein [Aphanothece sp. CMT-3BRIN-NPC111]
MLLLTHKKSTLVLLILLAAGYAGNYFSLPLFFGADFLFGSIAVLIVVRLFGLGWGMLAATLAGSYTVIIWNHPYAAIVLICETLFVGWLFHRKSENMVLLDGIYWVLIGMPLVWLFYFGLMHVDATQTLLAMFKQAVNGIFNALVANLIVTHLPIHKWASRPQIKKTLSLQQTLLNLLVAFVLFPTLMIMIVDGHRAMSNIETRVQAELQSTTKYVITDFQAWHQRRLHALNELAKIAAESDTTLISSEDATQTNRLQQSTKLIGGAFTDFSSLYVTDQAGNIIAYYSKDNNGAELKIGLNVASQSIFKKTKTTLKSLTTDLYFNLPEQPLNTFIFVKIPPTPHVGITAPVIVENQFRGFVYASLDLSKISERLKAHIYDQQMQISLIDRQGRIVTSTQVNKVVKQGFEDFKGGETQILKGDIYQWLPAKENLPPIMRWKKSFYVQKTAMGSNIPWNLVIKTPAALHINYLQNLYIQDLGIILIIAVLALVVADAVSRRLVRTLAILAQVTTNLPDKLLEREPIQWPRSLVAEIDSLVQNFHLMAIALNQRFQEIQSVNETLEQRVADRTDKLLKTNNKLRNVIKERQRAKEAVQESEQKYRSVVENVKEVIFQTDAAGLWTFLNPAWTEITGFSINESIGASFLNYVHPDDRQRNLELFQPLIQRQKEYCRHEIRYLTKEGGYRWIEVFARLTLDADNSISGTSGTLNDITERKLAEEALRKSENLYRKLAKNFPNGAVLLFDKNLRYTIADGAGLAEIGLSRELLEGKAVWEIFPPETCEIIEPTYRAALAGTATVTELIYSNHIYLRHTLPVRNEQGEIVAGMTMTQDITNLKQAEAEILALNAQLEQRVIERTAQLEAANSLKDELLIREQIARAQAEASEQRFRFLMEVIPQQVWTALPDGRLDYVNQRVLDYFASTSEQILGTGWQQMVHPEDLPRSSDRWSNSLATGNPYEIEFRLKRADGVYRWYIGRALPVPDTEGEIISWFGTNTDIDAQKQAEEVLRQQAEALEQANRIKDEFLAIVSHELRTPLNSMLGWAKLLRSRKFDEATTARALETIERNAKSQAQIIDDILEVSRIVRGKIRLNIRSVDVVSTIEAAIDAVRPTAEAKDIQIESMLGSSAGLISGDSERLQQVVWNLLSNAIKFTPKEGRVEVRLECAGSYAQIQVKDTGKGISAEFLPYVFEQFRQADSSMTRSYGGLGLGLAIVRQLVELHGGTVQAESEGEGQGATFTVKLPLIEGSKGNGETGNSSNSPLVQQLTPSVLSGLQVLVVDDEADTREFFITVLEECGAKVRAVVSAGEALELLKSFKPDVLVSDIGMPVEDGYSLIRKIRGMEAEPGQIPAMALTAYAREEDRQQALSAGFQMHISKPVEPAKLVAGVANLAGRTLEV